MNCLKLSNAIQRCNMNKINLLGRLQDFFNVNRKRRKKANNITNVIEKLHAKERKINEMLGECENEEIKKALQLEFDIITAQIEKGLSKLENL